MEKTFFPPCLSWNLGSAIVGRSSKLIAYISRRDIIILSLNGKSIVVRNIFQTHTKRLRALAIAPEGANEGLVSCSEDGTVKLWDLGTLEATKGHCGHESKDVVGVSWSPADPNIIVSCDVTGFLVEWHVTDNTIRKFLTARKFQAVAVACCPTDKSLVAVGAFSGLVVIVKLTGGGTVLHRLRAHESNIHSLVWQCGDDGWLACTSKQRQLAIFDTTKDGKMVLKVSLPTQCFEEKDAQEHHGKDTFFPLAWLDADTIVTVGVRGELVTLNVRNILENNATKGLWRMLASQWKLMHTHHKKSIVSILALKDLVLTVAVDRIFNLTTLSGELLSSWASLSGNPLCIALSPLEASMVAFGAEDGIIRLWDVSQPTGSCSLLSQNIQDSVSSLAWHPLKECTLAFGTSVGRIGIADSRNKKPPFLLESPSNKPVYWLLWGPYYFNAPLNLEQMALYVLTKMTLFVYNFTKSINVGGAFQGCKPEDFSSMLQLSCKRHTDIAWKPDWSLLAIGADDGSISLMVPPSKTPAMVIPAYSAFIQYLSWHPHMTTHDLEMSEHHGLITSGTRDPSHDINVFRVTLEHEANEAKSKIRVDKVAKLSGHLGYVQSVAWNPHEAGQLVSTSADSSVQIWDVLNETRLYSFIPRPGAITWFAIWSPLDSDYMIAGTNDCFLTVWQISTEEQEVPHKVVKHKRTLKSKLKGLVLAECKDDEISKATNGGEIEMAKKVPKIKITEPDVESVVWTTKDPNYLNLCQLLNDDTLNPNLFNLQLLKDEEGFKECVKQQEKLMSSDLNSFTSLYLWQGRLKEVIEENIKAGTITEELIAQAPSVSIRLWQEACMAMAIKARSSKNHRKSAHYYFICHQLYEAIEVLCEGNLFSEALTLARTQLTLDDPVVKDVVLRYGRYLQDRHHPDRAAECLVFGGDYQGVVEILSSSKDAEALFCVALTSKRHTNNVVQARHFAMQSLRGFLRMANSVRAANVVAAFSDFEDLNILYSMWVFLISDDPICDIFTKLPEEIQLLNKPQEYYNQLYQPYEKSAMIMSPEEMWATVADELSLALCSEEDIRQEHTLQAFHSAMKYDKSYLYQICERISPKESFKHSSSIFCGNTGKARTLRAYLCLAMILKSEQDQSTNLLPEIAQLEQDLLDTENFDYLRKVVTVGKCDRVGLNEISDAIKKLNLNGFDEIESDVTSIKNQLIKDIKAFEKSRGPIPNPVLGFQLLRNLCNRAIDDVFAQQLKDYIEERCLPLIQ